MTPPLTFCDSQGVPWAVQQVEVFGPGWFKWRDCRGRWHSMTELPAPLRFKFRLERHTPTEIWARLEMTVFKWWSDETPQVPQ